MEAEIFYALALNEAADPADKTYAKQLKARLYKRNRDICWTRFHGYRQHNNITAVRGVTGTEFRVWGFGVAQDVDAASTTIYAGYRHFESSIRCTDLVTAAICSGGVSPTAAPGTFTTHKLPTKPLDVIISGARVKF